MADCKLSRLATDDIAGIYEYDIRNFGLKQAQLYLREMEMSLEVLAQRPEIGIDSFFLSIRLFRFRQKAHVIFYKKEENGIRVVRILGSKMDFIRHL